MATNAVDSITANSTGPRSLRRPIEDRVTGVKLTSTIQHGRSQRHSPGEMGKSPDARACSGYLA
jgi:hypothetical protein